jgi:hypothetical protein
VSSMSVKTPVIWRRSARGQADNGNMVDGTSTGSVRTDFWAGVACGNSA